ncbi:hypothetical protein PSH81_13905 [Pseudomonas sp. FP2335]|uniref:hypothetical protein n=1 Tax=Pseudomonas sp. FP2335 TaxID=2954092 RepID=UPI0027335A51|nr:hypothetical protein [Pseudomonas sp. FP2335]WLH76852.1 hypothetical protein PSH81_13905 [Pseudomonas sp. FP2335]
MQFKPVAPGTIAALGRVVETASEIKGYAEALVAGLRECFDAQSPKSRWGVDFKVGADNVSATIESVFGKARSSLIVEIGDKELYGRYVIEKETRNSDGVIAWKPVWAIRVSKDGGIHDGETGAELFSAWRSFDHERTGAVHHLAGSMFYMIGKADNFPE